MRRKSLAQDLAEAAHSAVAGEALVRVELTRTELAVLQEMINDTAVFEGRAQTREAIREVIRSREAKLPPLCIEESNLAALAQRIVPIDYPTSALRSKLDRALQRERSSSEGSKARPRQKSAPGTRSRKR